MNRSICLIAAFSLIAAASTGRSADEKKVDPTKLAGDNKEAYDKMVATGQLTGKLVRWGEGSQKYMSVQVTVKYGVPNVDAIRNIAKLNNDAIEASRDANPVNRNRRLADIQFQIAKNKQNAITVKEDSKTVELQAGDEMKVKALNLPPMFDEKGNLKKPTAKELKERKGTDPKLPGYTAEVSDLKTEQMVTVYLAKKRDAGRPAPKDKDDALAENRPQVTMVVIVSEPPAK